jgi:hypothetical protein
VRAFLEAIQTRVWQGDAGTITFVGSRLDSRGNADTVMFDYQLVRSNGVWGVDRWLADSQTVHSYVRGDGCFRVAHAPFVFGVRIDTVLIRAERRVTGTTWNSFARNRLTPGPSQVGLGGPDGDAEAYWYVSHDSVHFHWGGWPSYVVVDLLLESDSLVGIMRWESDYSDPNPPKVVVTGKRVACSS